MPRSYLQKVCAPGAKQVLKQEKSMWLTFGSKEDRQANLKKLFQLSTVLVFAVSKSARTAPTSLQFLIKLVAEETQRRYAGNQALILSHYFLQRYVGAALNNPRLHGLTADELAGTMAMRRDGMPRSSSADFSPSPSRDPSRGSSGEHRLKGSNSKSSAALKTKLAIDGEQASAKLLDHVELEKTRPMSARGHSKSPSSEFGNQVGAIPVAESSGGSTPRTKEHVEFDPFGICCTPAGWNPATPHPVGIEGHNAYNLALVTRVLYQCGLEHEFHLPQGVSPKSLTGMLLGMNPFIQKNGPKISRWFEEMSGMSEGQEYVMPLHPPGWMGNGCELLLRTEYDRNSAAILAALSTPEERSWFTEKLLPLCAPGA